MGYKHSHIRMEIGSVSFRVRFWGQTKTRDRGMRLSYYNTKAHKEGFHPGVGEWALVVSV